MKSGGFKPKFYTLRYQFRRNRKLFKINKTRKRSHIVSKNFTLFLVKIQSREGIDFGIQRDTNLFRKWYRISFSAFIREFRTRHYFLRILFQLF